MTSLRWWNTMDGDRSIYIEDGQMMFVTEYHKSMALMDDQKVHTNVRNVINARLYPAFCHTVSVRYSESICRRSYRFV